MFAFHRPKKIKNWVLVGLPKLQNSVNSSRTQRENNSCLECDSVLKCSDRMSFEPENYTVPGVQNDWTVCGHLQQTLFNFWMCKGKINFYYFLS